MKTMNKLFLGLGFCAGLVSCSDFDEVNTNPTAAGEEYVKPQYALNNSIGHVRHGPGIAEVLASSTLYLSAHSDTVMSSGGCRNFKASFWYSVTSYLRYGFLATLFLFHFFRCAACHHKAV